ncbi:rhodanese-like domain-containing protein [Pseudoramibacter faecis]|uniref:rhodanese-like domain-containing protein n=1 Tax=Pseudoramibacter faecis TaxID=3108534 RepID=UPI002E76BC26|nr:rhodanese-like domain-containing protein [Pseudoramibacter sp. HA2172]
MQFFKTKTPSGIDRAVAQLSAVPGVMLIDVRTPEEYAAGHIPNSQNWPLQKIATVDLLVADKNVPVYLYCRTGRRSGLAARTMQTAGYRQVTNIGGIVDYTGALER